MNVVDLIGEWDHEDWEEVEEEEEDAVAPTEAARTYIANLTSSSGLHLRKPELTKAAYERHGEAGLFGLFVSEKLKSAWRTWTNTVLMSKGEPSATGVEIDAYIGLEMAMSLVPITDIKEFWSDKKFQGHSDFKETMSRSRFQVIRASFQLHPPYDSDEVISDTAECSDIEEAVSELASAAAAVRASGDDETTTEVDANEVDTVVPGISVATAEEAASALQVRGHGKENLARKDPLRHSRILLEHFQRKFASVAVPVGVSSIDEIGVRTKARTVAKSFMPLKPDKFAIRFYAVVGWQSLYVHSMWDNGAGNTLPTTASQRYTQLFPSLRRALEGTLARADIHIDGKMASSLWTAMIAHQTQLYPAESGRRLVISDNFYTRHDLAKAILAMTDGEVRMLGTARLDWAGRLNRDALADSVKRVAQMPRGSWELIAAVDSHVDSKKERDAHVRRQKKLPAHLRTAYAPPIQFSDRAGFVVFLDKQPVIFYTNDLSRTPSARVLGGETSEAIDCCNGLYPLRRWTGGEVMHRKTFMAPAVVALYNIGMNGVDRVDQLRSTNPTRRKEMRLSMSLFTWVLDLSTINAFALMQHIQTKPKPPKTLREFKRRVCESLTLAQRTAAIQREGQSKKRCQRDVLPERVNTALHILTPNSREQSSGKLVCHLCSLQGIKAVKSRFGCTQCLVGYHVACFAVAHYKEAFTSPTPSVAKALDAISNAEDGKAPSKTRRRLNNSTTSLDKLTLRN